MRWAEVFEKASWRKWSLEGRSDLDRLGRNVGRGARSKNRE